MGEREVEGVVWRAAEAETTHRTATGNSTTQSPVADVHGLPPLTLVLLRRVLLQKLTLTEVETCCASHIFFL